MLTCKPAAQDVVQAPNPGFGPVRFRFDRMHTTPTKQRSSLCNAKGSQVVELILRKKLRPSRTPLFGQRPKV
jgi:hypothetical protein